MELEIIIFYCTALHFAVKMNFNKIVKLLLSIASIDINIQDVEKLFIYKFYF